MLRTNTDIEGTMFAEVLLPSNMWVPNRRCLLGHQSDVQQNILVSKRSDGVLISGQLCFTWGDPVHIHQ
jgi:hypothetical protein